MCITNYFIASGMMYKPWILLFLAFFAYQVAAAQDKTEKVYISVEDGTAQVGIDNKWSAIQDDTVVTSNCWLKAGPNSRVYVAKPGLHRTIESRQKELFSQLNIMHFEPNQRLDERMKDGAVRHLTQKPVSRPTATPKGEGFCILFPADSELVIGIPVQFRWQNKATPKSRFLLAYADEEKWLCDVELNGDTTINATSCNTALMYDATRRYNWSVAAQFIQNSYFVDFAIASEADRAALAKDTMELHNNVPATRPLQVMAMAACYEAHHMFTEADKVYRQGIRSYPFSLTLFDAYQDFLSGIVERNKPKE